MIFLVFAIALQQVSFAQTVDTALTNGLKECNTNVFLTGVEARRLEIDTEMSAIIEQTIEITNRRRELAERRARRARSGPLSGIFSSDTNASEIRSAAYLLQLDEQILSDRRTLLALFRESLSLKVRAFQSTCVEGN